MMEKENERIATESLVVEIEPESAPETAIKEPISDKFKNLALSNFQRMTVDRIVKPQEEDPFDSSSIMWMFDIEDTPEKQEAFLAEIKEQTEVEEVDLGLVSLIKCEVLKDVQGNINEVYRVYEERQTVTTDSYIKIQMWSYFPIIGTVIYLLMLLAITVDKRDKYPVSLKNWAKAQLKFAWITVFVTAIVVFVFVASGISFVNIIQRGLSS